MVNSARGSGPARSQSPRGRPQSPRGGAKKVTPRGAPGPATNQQQRSNASSSQPLKATAAKLSAAGADKGISKEKNTESAAHLAEAALRKSGINVKLTDEATVMQTDTTMKAIQAAAKAGSDMAAKLGLEVSQAAQVYAAATAAAVAVLDPSGASTSALFSSGSSGNGGVTPMQRIENTLARALKTSAVKVMDLFKDWDEDGNGSISKKEFRRAMRGLGVEGTNQDHDELFDKWDVDGSGELDYNEISKALRSAQGTITASDLKNDPEGKFSAINARLIGNKKADSIKAMKAAKAAQPKAIEKSLSPRSQQLKEAAEREAEQKAREDLERLRKEEEDGTTWSAPKFLASRGVAKVVASALKLPPRKAGDQSHFAFVKAMSKEKVKELLDESDLGGLVEFVSEAVASLSAQEYGSAEKLNDKFASTGKFQMTYGSLSLFYGGLESLLGPPKMYKGSQHTEKSLLNMMEFEHCNEKDAKEKFDSNSGVTTTSETEWLIVVNPSKDVEYPERQGYRERHPNWCRIPTKLDDMLAVMETKCNERLRKDGHSEMIVEELIAGRLYTGPMCKFLALQRRDR